MMTEAQNALVTQVGPGAPAGAVLRRFWQPVGLAHDLAGPRPLQPVRVLGEALVLFRADDGRYGLLERHCPHRGADLCYGRLEDGGLRCAFHGWLFDVQGRCLEQPAEPAGSRFHTRIRQTAYPCRERNGIVFAYLGPGEPPALPDLDCFRAPAEYSFAFKGYMECNWLQALEIGIDPAHASFLHRFLADDDPAAGYGLQFRDATPGALIGEDAARAEERTAGPAADIPLTRLLREHPRPRIEVEETGWGLRIAALRELSDGRSHVRITNQVFPQAIVIPMSREMTITQWHVPVDDRRCYWYAIFTSFGAPVDQARMREQRLALYTLPDYRPRLSADNAYGYDWREQQTRTYTGMGEDINVHDQWAVESMGAIQDRTREHLGQTDAAIRAYRRRLLRAIEEPSACLAEDLRTVEPGPLAADVIVPSEGWQRAWRAWEASRRAQAPWADGGAASPARPAAREH